MIKPNGTDAKEIALHFIKLTQERTTPHVIGKTIVQAKTLLASGYTKQEILDVITHLVEVKKVSMYSIGYLNSAMNNVLREIQEQQEKERLIEMRKERMANQERGKEVNSFDEESRERNRQKAGRINLQSRFGKKFNFDMFEGQ